MKKIISLYYIITLLLTASCTKHILDKEPLDLMTDNVVWNDQTLIDAYLTNAYLKMYVFDNENDHHVSSSGQHFTIFMVTSVSDEAWSTHTWSGNANRFKNGGLTIGGGLMEWWESAYSVIRVLNEFIERVPSSPVEEQFKTARVAEARFLRAYAYFSMVKRYGGVPLVTQAMKISAPQDSLYPARSSENAIYDFVLSECDDIIGKLQETQTSDDYGRPTRDAALALKCRVALYAASIAKFGTIQLDGLLGIDASKANGYYQASMDAAKQIIDSKKYSLYNKYPDDKVKNFRNLFLDEGDNPEKIFVKPHDAVSADKGGGGWSYDFMQCPTPNAWGQGNNDGPYLEMAQAFEHVDGTSGEIDFDFLESKLWTTEELWANKDSRFYASIYTMNTEWMGKKLDAHNGIVKPDGTITTESYGGILGKGPTMKTGFGVLKYLDESHDNQGDFTTSQVDWIIFRYAEILLNYAEAAINLNMPVEALDAVNQIRERAGIALLASIDRDKIRQERKVELAFEGHRYWDLRRWRKAEEVLSINRSGLRYIHDYNTGKLKLSIIRQIDGTVTRPAFYAHNYYFPITLKRTGINKNLVENPGY